MAAPSAEMVGVSEESSSSDDEVLRRCQEAVWETKAEKKEKDGDNIVPQSKRWRRCVPVSVFKPHSKQRYTFKVTETTVVVAEHEHDGNELQVTKGFQTHVAKKLGNFLDSYITEMQTKSSTCADPATCEDDDDDDEDEGFRLFSSSVPGTKAGDPPALVRRRPAPSSSDSDSEMETRLREAAVSVKDLLPSFSSPSSLSTPSAEPPSSEKVKKKKKKTAAEEEERRVVKKKKKKQNQGESDSEAPQNNGNLEQEQTGTKVKKKKKQEVNV